MRPHLAPTARVVKTCAAGREYSYNAARTQVQPSQEMLRQAVEDFVPWTTRPHAELVAEVKAHMASEKLSQASLAQRIARSSGHVSQWMTGRLGASADSRFAAYLLDPTAFVAQLAALRKPATPQAAEPMEAAEPSEEATAPSGWPEAAAAAAPRSCPSSSRYSSRPSSGQKRPRREESTTTTPSTTAASAAASGADPAAAAALVHFLRGKGVSASKLDGWSAVTEARASGSQTGKYNVTFYFSPAGIKFRSRVGVLRSLA